MTDGTPSYFILASALFLTVGLLTLLTLYNLVAAWGIRRAQLDESASGLANASWGLGCLAAVVLPMAPILALLTIGLSFYETRRVYDGSSPLASATPARMARVNGVAAMGLFGFLMLALVVNLLL